MSIGLFIADQFLILLLLSFWLLVYWLARRLIRCLWWIEEHIIACVTLAGSFDLALLHLLSCSFDEHWNSDAAMIAHVSQTALIIDSYTMLHNVESNYTDIFNM